MRLDLDIRQRRGAFDLAVRARVDDGACTALWGPSGAGKSSTLMALAGLARPDDGHIRLGDRTLFDGAAGIDVPSRRRRLGVAFQDARLFPHMSVAGNLRFGQRRRRNRRGAAPGAGPDFDTVVELTGLIPLLDRRPRDLSGGERQRVALGRALLAAPDALLLDEPFAALDRPRKAEILTLIERIKTATALPMIIVSHDLDDVLRLADNLIALDGGRVAACGSIADLFADGRLRDLIGGDAFGAVLPATVAEQHEGEGLTGYRWQGGLIWGRSMPAAPGREVRLRVRARDVAIALNPPGPTSIRNVLAGTVDAIEGTGGEPLVAVRIGEGRLLAALSAGAIAALNLAPGTPVHAMVKAVAVEPTGGAA